MIGVLLVAFVFTAALLAPFPENAIAAGGLVLAAAIFFHLAT